MSNGLNLASRRLQLPQTIACDPLGTLIALPLVVEFQPRPCVRIHSVTIGSPKLTIGCGLRYEQGVAGPANSPFRAPLRRWSSLDRVCLDFVLSRIPGATGDRHRACHGRDGQELSGMRGQTADSFGAHVFQFKTKQFGRPCRAALIAMRIARGTDAWPRGQAWRS